MNANIQEIEYELDRRAAVIAEHEKDVAALKELIRRERKALASYLIPRRSEISDSWKQFFVEEAGVYFDEIGFVLPKPLQD